ncbi:kinase-like domain-containing protein, partial [Aspergillus unguis]
MDESHNAPGTFQCEEKYQGDAQMFGHIIQGQENICDKDHPDMLYSKRLLHELSSTVNPSAVLDGTELALADQLSTFFPDLGRSRLPFNDSEINRISTLLQQTNSSWSRVPRTYIVLRTIDCLDLLGRLIDLGFSDYWFPVTKECVPDCLPPKMRTRFMDAQELVLTKSLDLEKSEGGRHRHFKGDEPLPFDTKGVLGAGGSGQVDKVLSTISFREYARKRVPRKAALGGRGTKALTNIINEIKVLKKLKHLHIVEFVGSYTDPKYLSVIISPVAEMDLSVYLNKSGTSQHAEIRTFFGCLATALRFLHDHHIRHKDIKPGNILIDKGNILFTDFGLALDSTDSSGSTTVGMVNGMTPRYCAPEVALHEPRNTSSDIWSLGIIFLEMVVILKYRTVEWIDEFFRAHGSQQLFVRSNSTGLEELLAELKNTGSPSDNQLLVWVQQMLQEAHTSRPTAASLVTSITRAYGHGGSATVFCGLCCRVFRVSLGFSLGL